MRARAQSAHLGPSFVHIESFPFVDIFQVLPDLFSLVERHPLSVVRGEWSACDLALAESAARTNILNEQRYPTVEIADVALEDEVLLRLS